MMSQNQVFDGFGMTGRNISPSLSWSAFPVQTKNFAVTLFDPDAPTGSGWWHWVVLGIPASVTKLKAGAADTGGSGLPEGAFHVRNDSMVQDFGGAAPPEGHPPHRYVFAATDLQQRSPRRAGSQPGRLASWAQQPRRHKCPLASVRRSLCR